jgi:hypothetical protein
MIRINQPRAMPASLRWAGIALTWFWLAGACSISAQPVSKEYQVKAVFLLRLAQFAQWPSSAFETTNSPLVIGVLGDNPFGDALSIAVQGETAHHRRIVVRQFARLEQVRDAQLVYVSESERVRLGSILAPLSRRGILTVSSIERFADRGGMIQLTSAPGGKVALRVNTGAVKTADLALDARLLRMAEVTGSN